MRRPESWTDARPFGVDHVLDSLTIIEFTSLILGRSFLVSAGADEMVYPFAASVSVDCPQDWVAPCSVDLAAYQKCYGGVAVIAQALRLSMEQVFALFHAAHRDERALPYFNQLLLTDDDAYQTVEQAAYMRLRRSELLQYLVDEPGRWLTWFAEVMARFPAQVNTVLAVLTHMQSVVHGEQFRHMLSVDLVSGSVIQGVMARWQELKPHLDAAGCYHLLHAALQSASSAQYVERLLDHVLALWRRSQHGHYLSRILVDLCRLGDEARVRKILLSTSPALVAAMNHINEQGSLVLHEVIAVNMPADVVRHVIALTDDLSAVSPVHGGRTALQMACDQPRVSTVTHLMRYHCVQLAINHQDDKGDTAMHIAVRRGDEWLSAMLIEGCLRRGDDVRADLRNAIGSTVLHEAACRSNSNVLHLLLSHLNVSDLIDAVDSHGNTAWQIAMANGLTTNAMYLQSFGADTSVSNCDGQRMAGAGVAEMKPLLADYAATAPEVDGFVAVPEAIAVSAGPSEYVRADVFAVAKVLQDQVLSDKRFTHDVEAVRLRFDAFYEVLYRVRRKDDIEFELTMLHLEKRSWSEIGGVEVRSIVRSLSVVALQSLGYVQHLAVSGLAYLQQWVRYPFWTQRRRDPVLPKMTDYHLRAIKDSCDPSAVACVPVNAMPCTPPLPSAPVADPEQIDEDGYQLFKY